MPSAEVATLQRDADTLRVGGALTQPAIADAWPRALALLGGVRRLELDAVSRVDSAGVALLAELAHRAGSIEISGNPPGLAVLRAVYRLDANLDYAR